jgi:hypothetical protein
MAGIFRYLGDKLPHSEERALKLFVRRNMLQSISNELPPSRN